MSIFRKEPPPPVAQNNVFDRWMKTFFDALVKWSNAIDFSGSNITDIETRLHNDLQSIQGGTASERYHLTADELDSVQNPVLVHNDLSGLQGGSSTERYHLTAAELVTAIAPQVFLLVDDDENLMFDDAGDLIYE